MKLLTAMRRATPMLPLVLLLMLANSSLAQDANTSTNLLDRYGNLDIERTGPTIDNELAQKMVRRGNTYSNLERYDDAIAEYRKALSADPSFGEALRNLANTYYFLERFDQAKPLLARFIALQTETTAALIASVATLGELERKDENYEASIAYDLRAIELSSDNDSQVHIMANTYNNAGETDKAIQIYQAGIAAMPNNAFFDRSLGRLLEQENRLQEALAAYEAAAAKDPDSQFYADLVSATRSRLNR